MVLLLKAYLSEQLVESVGMRDGVGVFLAVLLVLNEYKNSRQIVLFDVKQAEVTCVQGHEVVNGLDSLSLELEQVLPIKAALSQEVLHAKAVLWESSATLAHVVRIGNDGSHRALDGRLSFQIVLLGQMTGGPAGGTHINDVSFDGLVIVLEDDGLALGAEAHVNHDA